MWFETSVFVSNFHQRCPLSSKCQLLFRTPWSPSTLVQLFATIKDFHLFLGKVLLFLSKQSLVTKILPRANKWTFTWSLGLRTNTPLLPLLSPITTWEHNPLKPTNYPTFAPWPLTIQNQHSPDHYQGIINDRRKLCYFKEMICSVFSHSNDFHFLLPDLCS